MHKLIIMWFFLVVKSSEIMAIYSLHLVSFFIILAIVGLGTASGQNFYSVSVDKVFFSNSNTVMKVIMDYTDVSGTIKTQWSKIKLSYIIVSPQF